MDDETLEHSLCGLLPAYGGVGLQGAGETLPVPLFQTGTERVLQVGLQGGRDGCNTLRRGGEGRGGEGRGEGRGGEK